MPVRRLLRCRRSRAYFSDGKWTDNPSEARHFGSAREVAEACIRHALKDVELVLQFTGHTKELCVPVR
jgi:hypothetical protein